MYADRTQLHITIERRLNFINIDSTKHSRNGKKCIGAEVNRTLAL